MYTAGARGERISKSEKLAVGLRKKMVSFGLVSRTQRQQTNKEKKSLQHLVFPGGHPSKY